MERNLFCKTVVYHGLVYHEVMQMSLYTLISIQGRSICEYMYIYICICPRFSRRPFFLSSCFANFSIYIERLQKNKPFQRSCEMTHRKMGPIGSAVLTFFRNRRKSQINKLWSKSEMQIKSVSLATVNKIIVNSYHERGMLIGRIINSGKPNVWSSRG